jgi:hypothetical protein
MIEHQLRQLANFVFPFGATTEFNEGLLMQLPRKRFEWQLNHENRSRAATEVADN